MYKLKVMYITGHKESKKSSSSGSANAHSFVSFMVRARVAADPAGIVFSIDGRVWLICSNSLSRLLRARSTRKTLPQGSSAPFIFSVRQVVG